MLIALISFLSLVLYGLYIRSLTQTKEAKKKLLKIYLILIPLAFVFYWISTYFLYYNKPKSLRTGIELLKKNKSIMDKIGGECTSYSYFQKDLPKDVDNPAYFKVSMEGAIATIYLTCKIQKINSDDWKMISIKQDSIKNKN